MSTPYEQGLNLKCNKGDLVAQEKYTQIIGTLMYVANTSRPNIFYAIGKLSRFNSCPSLSHWKALDRVLRYLRGTMSYGLYYSRFPVVLEGYSDAS